MKIFRRIFSALLRIGISIVLLVFLFKFQHVDIKRLLWNIRSADKLLLFWVFFVNFLCYALCLFRWRILLNAFGFQLPLKRIVISFAGGVFFSSLLPSTIGGDLVRSLDLAAHTKKTKEVVATVFLDRLSGCVGLAIVALLALFLGWRLIPDKSILFPVAIIIAILTSLLLVLFNDFLFSKVNKLFQSPNAGRIREALKNLHQEIYYFKNHKSALFKNLLFSVFIQLSGPVAFYLTALSLGQKLNIVYFLIFLPIIGAITLLPISIGGLGLRENTTVFFFSKTGMTSDLAGAMSFLNSIFILLLAATGGLIYVLTIHHRRIQPHKPS